MNNWINTRSEITLTFSLGTTDKLVELDEFTEYYI
jgi:hypothetical protein